MINFKLYLVKKIAILNKFGYFINNIHIKHNFNKFQLYQKNLKNIYEKIC